MVTHFTNRLLCRNGGGRLHAVIVIGAAATAVCAGEASAQTATDVSIERGALYLLNRRAIDGTWPNNPAAGEVQKIRDTLAAVRTLTLVQRADRLETPFGGMWAGEVLPLLGSQDLADTNARLGAQLLSGQSASATLEELLAAQNPDGGWGLAAGKESNVLDTVEAVDAMLGYAPLGIAVPAMEGARAYLESQQVVVESPDEGPPLGLWRVTNEESPSDVVMTARCLIALRELGAGLLNSAPTRVQELADAFLKSRLAAPELTALDEGFMLAALGDHVDPEVLEPLVTALEESQGVDGGWDDEPYTTAIVVRALLAVAPPAPGELPDLAVSAEDVWYDGSDSLHVVVRNIGEAEAADFQVSIFDGDPLASASEIAVQPPPEGAPLLLYPDTSWSAYVPSTLFRGQRSVTLGVVVDSGRTVRESNEANNIVVRSLDLGEGRPDFAIASSGLAATPIAGGWRFAAMVRNLGDPVSTAYPIAVSAALLDQEPGGQPTPLGAMTGGPATVAPFEVDSGPLIEGHTYTLTVTIDPQPGAGAAEDFTEDNNEATLEFTAAADLPDLVLDPASVTYFQPDGSGPIPAAELSFGQVVDVSARVTNAGTGASGASSFRVASGDPRGGTAIGSPISIPALAAGGEVTVTAEHVPIPFGATVDGDRVATLGLWIDAGQENTETNEDNNVYSETITVEGSESMPDLAIVPDSLQVSHASLDTNRHVRVSATVRNLGSASAAGVRVEFSAALDPGPEGPPLVFEALGSVEVGELAAGAARDVFLSWVPEANQAIRIRAEAKTEPVVAEVTRANNVLADRFTFQSSELTIWFDSDGTRDGSDGPGRAYSGTALKNAGGLLITLQPTGQVPGQEGARFLPRGYIRPAGENADFAPLTLSNNTLGNHHITWETLATMPPGEYEVRAELWKADSADPASNGPWGRLIRSATQSIQIDPSIWTPAVVPFVSPDVLELHVVNYDGMTDAEVYDVDSIDTLRVSLGGLRNVPVTYSVSYAIISPESSDDPITSPEIEIQLAPSPAPPTTIDLPLPDNLIEFTKRGEYSIVVTATLLTTGLDPEAPEVIQGRTSFVVEESGSLRLLGKIVEPDTVPPRDGERVHVRIRVGRGEP